jgi:hypothetical protein
VSVPPEVVEQLVAAVVDELAPRIAAELAACAPAAEVSEPWRLYDLEEAAGMFGRSTRWVRDRAKRGELPFVRLDGGALAFELADLQAFARARRVSVEPPALAGRLQPVREPAPGAVSQGADRVGYRRVAGA